MPTPVHASASCKHTCTRIRIEKNKRESRIIVKSGLIFPVTVMLRIHTLHTSVLPLRLILVQIRCHQESCIARVYYIKHVLIYCGDKKNTFYESANQFVRLSVKCFKHNLAAMSPALPVSQYLPLAHTIVSYCPQTSVNSMHKHTTQAGLNSNSMRM